jgi:Flp pilus assembly protein TadB
VRELPPSWRYALVGGAVALLALLALLVLPPRVVLGVLCGGIGLGMLAWEVRGRRKAARRRARR